MAAEEARSRAGMRRNAAVAVLGVALLAAAASAAVAPGDGDIATTVHRDGPEVVIDVDMRVDATPQQAFDVLTDYDHMSRFVSDLVSSRIIRRDGDRIEVAQQARFHFGPFALEAENVRAIDLVPPREIRSRLISGDMRSSTFVTRVTRDGNATRITNHGEFIPNRWIPPFVGPALVQAQTRKQFAEIRAEILRRKRGALAPAKARPRNAPATRPGAGDCGRAGARRGFRAVQSRSLSVRPTPIVVWRQL